ncbi:MAG TPA: hypothetical protein VFG11_11735 [Acidobacteriota bacterium]|nr:hypothetical protein [Acidobacteriota bacterium]
MESFGRKRIQFALHLAQEVDLKTLRLVDFLALREDLLNFLGLRSATAKAISDLGLDRRQMRKQEAIAIGPGDRPFIAMPASVSGILAIPEPPTPLDYSEADFLALQKKLLGVFHALVEGRKQHVTQLYEISPASKAFPKIRTRENEEPMILFSGSMVGFASLALPAKTLLLASGPTDVITLLVLHYLLSCEPANRLLRCPECGKIFYRIRKQAYCSRACTNRVLFRRWQQSKKKRRRI